MAAERELVWELWDSQAMTARAIFLFKQFLTIYAIGLAITLQFFAQFNNNVVACIVLCALAPYAIVAIAH